MQDTMEQKSFTAKTRRSRSFFVKPLHSSRLRGKNSLQLFSLIIALALLAGCGRFTAFEPTPVIAGFTESAPDIQSVVLTPTFEPFRFELPAQGAAPVSGWRPPL